MVLPKTRVKIIQAEQRKFGSYFFTFHLHLSTSIIAPVVVEVVYRLLLEESENIP
jgi:hypothetical protein